LVMSVMRFSSLFTSLLAVLMVTSFGNPGSTSHGLTPSDASWITWEKQAYDHSLKKFQTSESLYKKNLKISFNNILSIESKEKVWGSVLFLDIIEGGKEKKLQFSVVQDWVKYPISAPTKFLKVDWSGFVKYIKDRQIVMK